jgi:hypothetical protein
MLAADRLAAVSALDSALHQGIVTERDLPDLDRLMARRRGAVNAREWIELADARAESPLETRVRLRCRDGGVPPDDLQAEVRGPDGKPIARVDLLWRGARLIGEADGAEFHDQPEAVFRDRQRQNLLINAGFRVLRFTWADTLDPGRVVQLVRQALAR